MAERTMRDISRRGPRPPRGVNTAVVALLHSKFQGPFGRRLCALRITGRRSGRKIVFPVRYAPVPSGIVVVAGHGAGKTWWRNLLQPAPVDVLLDGRWNAGTGRVLPAGSPERSAALSAYRSVYRRVPADTDDPVIQIAVGTPAHDPRLSGARLWRAWTGWVTAGETMGFLVPALAGALTAEAPAVVSVPGLLAAGAVEGALLGAAQGHVLRRALSGLPVRRWIAATSVGAVLAWLIGLLPGALGGRLADWPLPLLATTAALGAAALLLSIGTAQWLVLRRRVERAWRWIPITAGAWLAGLTAFTLVAPPLWREGQPAALVATIGVGGGLVMAGTVAAVSGLGLVRILRDGEPAPLPGDAIAG